jgi:hypothetical protein
LTLDHDGIVKLLDDYDKESRAIKKEILRLAWNMRGGLTYSEAMELSSSEREIIEEIITSNLETTKETGLPYF